jgi:hypothetical protein
MSVAQLSQLLQLRLGQSCDNKTVTPKLNCVEALVLQHNLILGLASIVAWDHCPERALDSTQDWKDGTNGPILRYPKVKL